MKRRTTPPTEQPGRPQAGTRTELAGIKVADFTNVMAGPYCTRLMADLGAEVVKVESPSGDPVRTAVPVRDGHSSYFGMLNVGKKAVVLDLKVPEGRNAAAAIAGWADVVVESFRPGVMERFGLDYASLAATNQRLVYCSISGYGQSGPWIARPATAQAIHAVSGFDLALLGFQTGIEAPLSTGLFVADALAGSLAFGAILAGLRARDTTGVGGQADLSMLDGILSAMAYEVQTAQFPPGYDRKGYPPARTCDGFVMIAVTSQRHLEALAGAIGRPELIEDPRFATMEARWQHTLEFHQYVEAWTATRTAAECEEVMNRAGVPSSRYLTVAQQLAGAQLQARGSLLPVTDPAGTFHALDTPFRWRSPAYDPEAVPARQLRSPGKGEHTREVLTHVLGAAAAETAIAAGGAIDGSRIGEGEEAR